MAPRGWNVCSTPPAVDIRSRRRLDLRPWWWPPSGSAPSTPDAREDHVAVLRARGLVVEVAGTTLVERVDIAVRPGEKVGLVGRNGAGKTSLLRVLGGEARPKAGAVERPTATGYLSQDPRADAVPPDTGCLVH